MDTLRTYPDHGVCYPVTTELNGDKLFTACADVLSHLEGVLGMRGDPGAELFFTGTSGASIATMLGAVNRQRPRLLNLAFAHVTKKRGVDEHHRFPIESTHNSEEKKGFPKVFVDDFMSSGDTFRRTRKHVRNASKSPVLPVDKGFRHFEGIILLCGAPIEEAREPAEFVIRPEEV